MRKVRAAALVSWVALGSSWGCDEPRPTDEGPVVLATLDTHHFCDMDAVVVVRLRARWLACAAAEPGCDPPAAAVVDGDRYTCPATDSHHDLGVPLSQPGRYRVEAVAELTTGEEEPECFVEPDTGDAEIELSTERLEESPVLLTEHGPCPP